MASCEGSKKPPISNSKMKVAIVGVLCVERIILFSADVCSLPLESANGLDCCSGVSAGSQAAMIPVSCISSTCATLESLAIGTWWVCLDLWQGQICAQA